MARKKKVIEEKVFIPSKYQQAIFDFIEHGVGNLVIDASAGSAKTTTLLKSLELIPNDQKVLFCAFNKDIVTELKRKVSKLENIENVDIRTLHSLGYLMIQRNLGTYEIAINENKYRQFVFNNINELTFENPFKYGKKNGLKWMDNVCSLINYIRYNLAESDKEIYSLIKKHELDIINDEVEVAKEALEWGKTSLDEVDYTDMVWLPYTLNMKPLGLQYDYIFVDESQDVSVVQRELILRCKKLNTRYIFAGDQNQAIYAFSSASPESFNFLKTLPNTISLPLPISYRCAKNIVEFAKRYSPSIESNDDGREGIVSFNETIENVNDGDMVLCRNNAPLMKVYNDFIRLGKKCYIRGKDIGLNLKKLVESTNQEKLNVDLSNDGVFVRLYNSLFETRDKLIKQSGLDEATIMNSSMMVNKLDMIKALEVLSEDVKTSDELIDKIKEIFSDKKKSGISLSTIHKAKGLEADNVYIACNSLMPSRSATQQWELDQEKNLMYVAYTRAKNKLGFLDESEFKSFTSDANNNTTLNGIEKQVNFILNKKKKFINFNDKKEVNRFVKNIEKIESPKKTNFTLLSSNKQPINNNLNSLSMKKITKTKKNVSIL
ncbi:MAG: ATP-dependent helicase [Bacilli bacterium]|nr:ATP-dependent helicase [Bacilli bacterium]